MTRRFVLLAVPRLAMQAQTSAFNRVLCTYEELGRPGWRSGLPAGSVESRFHQAGRWTGTAELRLAGLLQREVLLR